MEEDEGVSERSGSGQWKKSGGHESDTRTTQQTHTSKQQQHWRGQRTSIARMMGGSLYDGYSGGSQRGGRRYDNTFGVGCHCATAIVQVAD